MTYKSEQHSETKMSVSGLFTYTRNPYQVMLFLGFGGSTILFLIVAVMYGLLKGGSRWVHFHLPQVFWISTGVIILSSVVLHLAYRALEKEAFLFYKVFLGIVLVLACVFAVTQGVGWRNMAEKGILLNKSTAGAFLYILSGLHLLHVAVGIVLLSILLGQALRRTTYIDSFIYSVNPPNQLRIRLMMQYWHFVDILWIGLFLFFLYHHS